MYIMATGTNEKSFDMDLIVDKVPYRVRVTPFLFNDEKRFRISINGEEEDVFAWDPEILSLRALDDESGVLPVNLEKAIGDRLVKTILA